jgi:DNA polymerase III delta prime subunit
MPEHHATLFVTKNPKATFNHLKSQAVDVEIVEYSTETLSIGEVRRIITMAYQSAGASQSRCLFIITNQIAIEAQHALLKILEEPPATTKFVCILPSSAGLLPTILSRLQVVVVESESIVPPTFVEWLSLPVPARLALIAEIAKSKDDTRFVELEHGLIANVSEAGATLPIPVKTSVMTTLRRLSLRGASKKMLWEDLSFVFPVRNA